MGEFFSSTLWIVISAIISVIGLIGTALGIYQYIKSSQELREYKYLFKIAGQHVDLEDKKNQINDYENQIAHMQKTIKEQIPEEAKKIALRGMLDNEMQVLSSTYTKVKSLQSELEALTSEDIIETKELMQDVNKVIEPAYSRKRSDSLFSTVFYLVSVASSFLSMILPHSIYQIVILVVLLLQLIIGVRTMINTLKLNYTRKEINAIVHKAYLMAAIVFFVIFLMIIVVFLLFMFYVSPYYVNEESFLIIAAIFFVFHLIFGFTYFVKESKKNLIVWFTICFLIILIITVFVFTLEPFLLILGGSIVLTDIVFLCVCLKKNEKV